MGRKPYLRGQEVVLLLFCALLILTAAAFLTLIFRPLYYADIYHLNIPAQSGLEPQEIRANYDALVRYNLLWSDGVLDLPSFMMSREGRQHFAEVRRIFCGIQIAFLISLAVTAWGLWRQNRLRRYGYLKGAAILAAAVPLGMAACAALFWEKAFTLFHKLLFQNEYWLFDPQKDPVITILPDRFFFHCALALTLFALAGSLLCYGVYRLLRRRELEYAAAAGDAEAAEAIAEAEEENLLERVLNELDKEGKEDCPEVLAEEAETGACFEGEEKKLPEEQKKEAQKEREEEGLGGI